MLVIAVFAVGSMLSAYQSASNVATPRSFSLVVADDVSQNALSTFIGAFIFSIVAQVALMNEYYGNAGRFALFIITVCVFAIVIFNFIRWVDRIARDGAGIIEVVVRLEKGLATLASLGDEVMKTAAVEQGRLVFAHAEQSLKVTEEIAKLRSVSSFAVSQNSDNS
jgi:uncharacterized membrane protein